MFRTKVNEDIRIIRREGAKRCLRNLHQYVENVTYCDTQRFSYDEKGNIALNFGSEKEEANTVLVWCMISSFAQMSALCRVNGKFDSNNYKNILWQYVLPLSLNERIGLVHDWYPVHRRKSVNEFLAEHKRNIFVVDLPKSFGDIMPLEQLWLEMSIKFTEENVKASSLCGLEREITSMW
ncbi:uncharacterized protein LOC123475495 [Daphnia magna]|uniref:uncharacterized protein LOC116923587 n=1 Tax=Daphnia magna TaxID=35525 RepID=UPI001402EA6D|nr:uncharacterized protein LOC116923587 [Daphnia magna]XP_045034127.1 uncharacterized protein LOC123475495 [Daphnia magna]